MDEQDSASKRRKLSLKQAGFSPAKQALLEKRMRGELPGLSEKLLNSRIVPVSRDLELPLTVNQHFVTIKRWQKMTGDSIISKCFRLTGELNVAALERAVNELARRHEVLRTLFPVVDGQPGQVIAPTLSLSLPVIVLEHVPLDERLDRALRIISEEASRPFDLTHETLWRTLLVRLRPGDHLMLLAMDHLISDAWAMDLLVRDAWTLYGACAKGSPSPLADLPIQLADFAYWQRQTLRGEVLERLVSYWERQLKGRGLQPEFRLPNENPRPRPLPFQPYASEFLNLPVKLSESLIELGRQRNVTPAMLLLAALVTLLYKYTGESDVGLRFIAAKRHRPETTEVIGWFSDILLLRAKVADGDAFSDVLDQVRDLVLQAYDHQDLPFIMFPGYEQSMEKGEFYPVILFNMIMETGIAPQGAKNHAEPQPKLPLNVKAVRIPSFGAPARRTPGMAITVTQDGGGLILGIKYEIERYEVSVIKELLINFMTTLERIVADPSEKLSDFPVVIQTG